MRPRRVVVVGASLAGATTAVTLRRLGFEGELVLLGDERHLPYERPPLSKDYLAGRTAADRFRVHPPQTYADLGIGLRLGVTAAALDAERREVVLADGDTERYDACVVATGSRNVVPPIPGIDLAGVHSLRSLDDANRLAAEAAPGRTAVVVGMGFVGCEVAATLRGLGLEVTMVDRLGGPLLAQVGPQLSARVRGWHESAGVRLVTGVDVAALGGRSGRVEEVRLADGRRLPADLVVVGVGVRPATDWLAAAPLHLVRGAVGVDGLGRSSAPRVHAAGDVAAVWDDASGTHRRTEHYRSAVDQGERVAHAVLGLPVPQPRPSEFWSDQYEHVLHVAGERDGADLHERPDPYAAFYLRDGRLVGVSTVDNGRDFRRALRLLGAPVDPALLRDPAVDLRQPALRPAS